MKKLIMLFLVLFMVLSVASCANVYESTENDANLPIATNPSSHPTTPSTSTIPNQTEPEVPSTETTDSDNTTKPTDQNQTTPSTPEETRPTEPEPSNPPHEHDYIETSRRNESCAAEGEIVYQCECGDVIKERLPALDHNYEESKRINPSCTQEGYIIYTCKCSSEIRERLPIVAHSYKKTEKQEPTCTQTGYILYACKCGTTKTETLPKATHQYTIIETIPATCTSEGQKIQKCVCGDTKTESIKKTEHKHKEVSRTQPSCTKEGSIIYRCDCGHEKIESIAKIKHEYVLTETIESTTTQHGKKIYTCKNCTASYSEELPLKPPAKDTDMCGESLWLKPLKHGGYYEFACKIFEMLNKKMTYSEASQAGPLDIPDDGRKVVQWFSDTYCYAAYPFSYTLLRYDDRPDQWLIWGSAEDFAQMDEVSTECKRILAELNINSSVTQKEAITRINDYLCRNRYYEYDETKRDGTPYNSIFGESGVCHNYALAFQMLCLHAGIECHYYSSDNMNHAWNKVYFSDGTYYWVDVCWNDARYQFGDGRIVEADEENGVPASKIKKMRSRYLLITTEKLLEDHQL